MVRIMSARRPGRTGSWVWLVLLATGCAAPLPRPDSDQVTVKLVAFNDFHGHLEPPGTPLRTLAEDSQTELRVPTGGVAWLSGAIATLKQQNSMVAVVAAGDLIGGAPLISSLLNHESTIHALGDAGLEFSAVGNHEFDRGVDELLRLQAIGHFRYLGANVRYRSSGQRVFPAWATKRWLMRGGATLQIAFVGAVLRDTPALVGSKGVAEVEFLDEAEAVNDAVREIRAQGIEAIVLLLHEGGYTSQERFDDLSCPDFRGPILGIVERLDPAVDVVISGHTHRAYVCRHHGRLVTSAGQEGRLLTDIELTVDSSSGDVRDARARQWPVVNDTLPNPLPVRYPVATPDASLQARVASWAEAIAPLADRTVGYISAPLTRRTSDAGETTLGSAVADAQLAATAAPNEGEAQIAFVNTGGLRADLASPDGRVSHEQTFAVHPFGNRLVTLSLSGSQIDELLETQWQGAGSLLQVSAGFRYLWSVSAPTGARIAPSDLLLDGEPLLPDSYYRVTVSDFLADGGDGYAVLLQGRDRVPGMLDIEALETYLHRHAPLPAPVSGRIVKLP
jgi:5'-nucleotidase